MFREGGRIAAILLFWGALAAVGRFGIGNVGYGHPGGFFATLGDAVARGVQVIRTLKRVTPAAAVPPLRTPAVLDCSQPPAVRSGQND